MAPPSQQGEQMTLLHLCIRHCELPSELLCPFTPYVFLPLPPFLARAPDMRTQIRMARETNHAIASAGGVVAAATTTPMNSLLFRHKEEDGQPCGDHNLQYHLPPRPIPVAQTRPREMALPAPGQMVDRRQETVSRRGRRRSHGRAVSLGAPRGCERSQ